jgi:BlaI family penicillinase repressor
MLKHRKHSRETPVPPRISEAEWVVMKTLWTRGSLTTNQVVDALAHQSEWKPKTIHTLLKRLVDKGALATVKVGREFCYTPEVTAEEAERTVTRSFLERFFDGDVAPFLARFVEQERLTRADVERLKNILDPKKP